MKQKKNMPFFILLALISIVTFGCEKEDTVFSPDLALNSDTLMITSASVTSNVLVFSNTDWLVEIEDPENSTWIELLNGDSPTTYRGSGRNYFQFSASLNDNNTVRYGTLIITTAQSRKTLVVRQNK